MSTRENDIYLENIQQRLEQVIAEGDEKAFNGLLSNLRENGFEFAAQMSQSQWDDKQEL